MATSVAIRPGTPREGGGAAGSVWPRMDELPYSVEVTDTTAAIADRFPNL